MLRTKRGPLFVVAAIAAALAFTVATADARSKGSMGSRGTHTYSAPPSTATAPNATRPMDRTMAQPNQARPATPATTGQAARPGGLFGGGLLGGLAAGFIGAGLFGMLFGHGFMGVMGGFASFLGLLLQIGIIVVIGMLLYRWWQRRNGMEPATASGPSYRQGLHGNGYDQQASPMLGGLF